MGKGVTHASIISSIEDGIIKFSGNSGPRLDESVMEHLEDYKGGVYIVKIRDEIYGRECPVKNE